MRYVNIVTNKTNESLFKEMLNDVSEKSESINESIIVFVPEKYAYNVEKHLLIVSKRKAIANVQVVTFSRLIKKLSSTKQYLSREAGVMITKRLIDENIEKLVCYKKTAKTIGFAESIYDTISNLKNSKVSPEDYIKKGEKLNPTLKLKLKDIFLLYSEYEEYIADKYIDACDRFDMLANSFMERNQLNNSHCYIFGYENVTKSGLSIFESIMSSAKACCFYCLNNNVNNSLEKPEFYNQLLEIANKQGIKPSIITKQSKSNYIADHISNYLYSLDNANSIPKQELKENELIIYEAKNVVEEIDFVAKSIRRLIIENKYRYNEIGIVCPNFTGYADLIASTFSDYQIPFFIDRSEELLSNTLIRFVMSVLNVVRKNYDANEMRLLIKNIFSGVKIDDANIFENYIIQYGIGYDKFKSPFVFGKLDEQNQLSDNYFTAESVRSFLYSRLHRIEKKFKNSKCVADYISVTKSIFDVFELDSAIEKYIENTKNANDLFESEKMKQVKDKFMELLDTIEKIFVGAELKFDEFYSLLLVGQKSAKISLIPFCLDTVFVGDISNSKFLNSKALFLIGASDGAVPYVKDDCGIIIDKEIGTLSASIGKKIEPTIKTINAREKYKLYLLLQAFSETLYISYPLLDAKNNTQRESAVIRELKKIFKSKNSKDLLVLSKTIIDNIRGLLPEQERVNSYAFDFSTRVVGKKKLSSAIRDYKANQFTEYPEAISSLYYTLEDKLNKTYKNLLNNKSEKIYEKISDKKFFFPKGKTSISELECYFTCPYKHYVTYGLIIKERENAKLKSIDYGNVLHKVAEEFVKALPLLEPNQIQKNNKIINNCINKVFASEKLLSASNKHSVVQLKNESNRLIKAIIYQADNSNFKPKEEEFMFGENNTITGIKLGNGISLEGKIDRIDECGKFVRVIDYKTGAIDLSPSLIYYGKKLQLFAYMLALKSKRNKTLIGSFYFPIKNVYVDEEKGDALVPYKMQGFLVNNIDAIKNMDTSLSFENSRSKLINVDISTSKANIANKQIVVNKNKCLLSEEQFALAENYVYEIMKQAVDEIRQGNIEPSPIMESGRLACEYCDYKYLCGIRKYDTKRIRKITKSIGFDNYCKEKEITTDGNN